MANHSFDIDVAAEYGVHAAIMLNNIYFWVLHNKAIEINYYDDCYWTFNSLKSFAKDFPYLTERQIRTALQKLIDAGLIKTGCFNKEWSDRTLWYTLTDKGFSIMQNSQMQMTKKSNDKRQKSQMTFDQNVQAIPDNNTTDNITTDNNIYLDGFDVFYSVYPRHVNKRKSLEQWKKLKPDKILQERIISDVKRKIDGEWKDREEKYIPYPSTYLNQHRWEDGDNGNQKSRIISQTPKDTFGINKNDEPRKVGNGTVI